MPRYHFVASDAAGRRVERELEAASAQAAEARLRAEGLQGLELVSSNALSAGALRPEREALARGEAGARDRMAFARAASPGAQALVAAGLAWRRLWWVSILGLTLLVSRRVEGVRAGAMDAFAVLLVLLPPVVGVLSQRGAPARYRALLEALGDARWHDALAALAGLDRVLQPMTSGLYRARCLVGLGQLEAGYRLAASLRPADREQLVPYLGQVLPVYDEAHDVERVVAIHREALELAPDKAVFQVGLALALALRTEDQAGARQALEASAGGTLPSHSAFARPLVEALLAVRAGRAEEALAHAARARALVTPHLEKSAPIRRLAQLIDFVEALAWAREGQRERSRAAAAGLRPLLQAHRDAQLLAELDAAAA